MTDSQLYCEECCSPFPDDPQAYHASAYRASLTPQVVVGSLIVVTVIAIVLINSQGNSGHHSH